MKQEKIAFISTNPNYDLAYKKQNNNNKNWFIFKKYRANVVKFFFFGLEHRILHNIRYILAHKSKYNNIQTFTCFAHNCCATKNCWWQKKICTQMQKTHAHFRAMEWMWWISNSITCAIAKAHVPNCTVPVYIFCTSIPRYKSWYQTAHQATL